MYYLALIDVSSLGVDSTIFTVGSFDLYVMCNITYNLNL